MDKQFKSIASMDKITNATAGKVDRLQQAMSVFMTRISQSVNTLASNTSLHTQESLCVSDITEYLDNDKMEVDSILGKRKPPSADEDSSLSDGGGKK